MSTFVDRKGTTYGTVWFHFGLHNVVPYFSFPMNVLVLGRCEVTGNSSNVLLYIMFTFFSDHYLIFIAPFDCCCLTTELPRASFPLDKLFKFCSFFFVYLCLRVDIWGAERPGRGIHGGGCGGGHGRCPWEGAERGEGCHQDQIPGPHSFEKHVHLTQFFVCQF